MSTNRVEGAIDKSGRTISAVGVVSPQGHIKHVVLQSGIHDLVVRIGRDQRSNETMKAGLNVRHQPGVTANGGGLGDVSLERHRKAFFLLLRTWNEMLAIRIS